MSKKSSKLEDALNERTEIEDNPDEVRNEDVKITRGRSGRGRGRVLQVRLTDEEFAAIEALAEARDLPASTYARSVLLNEIEQVDGEEPASLAEVLKRVAQQNRAAAATLEGLAGTSSEYCTTYLAAEALRGSFPDLTFKTDAIIKANLAHGWPYKAPVHVAFVGQGADEAKAPLD